MGRGVLAAALAAAVMFVWGFVGHLIDVPPMGELSNGGTVAEVLRRGGAGDGVYALHATDEDRFARGPRAVVFCDTGEVDPDSFLVLTMIKGFVVLFLSALFVAFLLERAKIARYGGRVMFCAAFGLFAAMYGTGSQWAWFHAPGGWFWGAGFHDVVAWTGAGLVLGGLVPPENPSAPRK